jgi:phage baseplate assembly protein gpV
MTEGVDPFDGMLPADVREGVVYQMRDGRPYPLPNIKRLDTTMRPMPDTVGKAIERAKDKIDYDAADIGVAAVVLAQGINPGGSKAGRERLVDAVTAAEKSTPLEAFREGYAMGYSHAFHEAEVEGSLNRIVEMASEIRAKLTAGQPKACGT